MTKMKVKKKDNDDILLGWMEEVYPILYFHVNLIFLVKEIQSAERRRSG